MQYDFFNISLLEGVICSSQISFETTFQTDIILYQPVLYSRIVRNPTSDKVNNFWSSANELDGIYLQPLQSSVSSIHTANSAHAGKARLAVRLLPVTLERLLYKT
jgi:hypothetical protein